jgi:hypothetical protein
MFLQENMASIFSEGSSFIASSAWTGFQLALALALASLPFLNLDYVQRRGGRDEV